jgi:hypothetical protein
MAVVQALRLGGILWQSHQPPGDRQGFGPAQAHDADAAPPGGVEMAAMVSSSRYMGLGYSVRAVGGRRIWRVILGAFGGGHAP